MTNTLLMPMATAVWLVENTTLTFKQIAEFCNLHEVEIQGIADGEVAKGIVGYNPIIAGQLTKEEIELSSKDQTRSIKKTLYINRRVQLATMEYRSPGSKLRGRAVTRRMVSSITSDTIKFKGLRPTRRPSTN